MPESAQAFAVRVLIVPTAPLDDTACSVFPVDAVVSRYPGTAKEIEL